MLQAKPIRFGPVTLSLVTTTNILNPPTLTGGTGLAGANVNTFLLIRHVRVVNRTVTPAVFGLWLGATGANAAGTEVIAAATAAAGAITAGGVSVGPSPPFDWYGQLRLDVADFLVGGAGTAAALTIEGEGEISIV